MSEEYSEENFDDLVSALEQEDTVPDDPGLDLSEDSEELDLDGLNLEEENDDEDEELDPEEDLEDLEDLEEDEEEEDKRDMIAEAEETFLKIRDEFLKTLEQDQVDLRKCIKEVSDQAFSNDGHGYHFEALASLWSSRISNVSNVSGALDTISKFIKIIKSDGGGSSVLDDLDI